MWKCAHDRSKKDGLEFNISVLDIKIPERCPLLNIPIVQNKGKYGPCANSPSLDRIDSSRGYTQDNIWVISHKANTIKSNATVSEIRLIADNLEGKINEISRHTFENQPRIGTI